METIHDLQKLCDFASTIKNNDLHIWWTIFLKSQTNNKEILKTYDQIIKELESNYLEEGFDPASIVESVWGIGSKELYSNPVTLHKIYYFTIVTQIKIFLINKIFILSTDKGFQVKAQNILDNLETFYTVPSYVKSKGSTFHSDTGSYRKWKYDRVKIKKSIDVEIDNLRKLVDEYS